VRLPWLLVAGVLTVMWLSPAPLASVACADPSDGTIHGTVHGTDGHPAAQVEVKLFQAGARGKDRKPAQTKTTDQNGQFTFSDVAPGDYVLEAGGKGVGHGRAKTHVGSEQVVNVDIGINAHGHSAHK
jgi:5-hydroxyisourate hydrolase-like protein (transthyretin family)